MLWGNIIPTLFCWSFLETLLKDSSTNVFKVFHNNICWSLFPQFKLLRGNSAKTWLIFSKRYMTTLLECYSLMFLKYYYVIWMFFHLIYFGITSFCYQQTCLEGICEETWNTRVSGSVEPREGISLPRDDRPDGCTFIRLQSDCDCGCLFRAAQLSLPFMSRVIAVYPLVYIYVGSQLWAFNNADSREGRRAKTRVSVAAGRRFRHKVV